MVRFVWMWMGHLECLPQGSDHLTIENFAFLNQSRFICVCCIHLPQELSWVGGCYLGQQLALVGSHPLYPPAAFQPVPRDTSSFTWLTPTYPTVIISTSTPSKALCIPIPLCTHLIYVYCTVVSWLFTCLSLQFHSEPLESTNYVLIIVESLVSDMCSKIFFIYYFNQYLPNTSKCQVLYIFFLCFLL